MHLSLAGRSVLINTTLFAIPIYISSVMNLPNTILDSISKLARDFLWGHGGNKRGFHSVGWALTTQSKPEGEEGGLGIKNLRLVKHSLMAKNIFAILDSDNKIWVDIFKDKYHGWHPWKHHSPARSSWFFKSICNTSDFLRANFKIISLNSNGLDWWTDPWIMD